MKFFLLNRIFWNLYIFLININKYIKWKLFDFSFILMLIYFCNVIIIINIKTYSLFLIVKYNSIFDINKKYKRNQNYL